MAKLPVALANDSTGKSWPSVGLKPLTRLTFKSPPSAAEPVATTCPNWPLAGVPPICTSSVPAEVCVKLPATVERAAGADGQVAAVAEIAGGGEAGPAGETQAAAVGGQTGRAAIVAPAPPRAMLAALLVMVVPLGNCSVAPSSAFQVPPVSVLLESWLNELGLERQRAGVGLDRAGIGQRAIDGETLKCRCRRSSRSCRRCRWRWLLNRLFDAGVRLDQVRTARLDHERGGEDVVAVQTKIAGAGLDDRAVVVERAVVIDLGLVRPGEVDGSLVGHVPDGALHPAAGPLEHAAGKVQRHASQSDGSACRR